MRGATAAAGWVAWICVGVMLAAALLPRGAVRLEDFAPRVEGFAASVSDAVLGWANGFQTALIGRLDRITNVMMGLDPDNPSLPLPKPPPAPDSDAGSDASGPAASSGLAPPVIANPVVPRTVT